VEGGSLETDHPDGRKLDGRADLVLPARVFPTVDAPNREAEFCCHRVEHFDHAPVDITVMEHEQRDARRFELASSFANGCCNASGNSVDRTFKLRFRSRSK